MGQTAPRTVRFLPADDPRAPAAEAAFNAVAGRMGLRWRAVISPAPADHVVSFHPAPVPPDAPRSEPWTVPLAEVEPAVTDLIARLLGGGGAAPAPPPAPTAKPKKPPVVKVGRETAGRRGKGVTVVSEVPLNDAGLIALAATLKQRCGTGGTVKDGRIEIQGDQRDRIMAELVKLGYAPKKAGG